MKKLIKSRIFLLILIETVIVILLALFGFRITYNPSLENNWNAISACADWATVIVSLGAVYYAINVPKKISNEQNKIALFEKRFDSFISLQRYMAFAEQLKKTKDLNKCKQVFCMSFDENENVSISSKDAAFKVYALSTPLQQMSLLYDNIPNQETKSMYECLLDLVVALYNNENIEKLKNKYIDIVDSFTEQYGNFIIEQLMLSK